jgi:hypothetical protein
MSQHRTSLRIVAGLIGIGVATTACGLKQGAVDGLKTVNGAAGTVAAGQTGAGGAGAGAAGGAVGGPAAGSTATSGPSGSTTLASGTGTVSGGSAGTSSGGSTSGAATGSSTGTASTGGAAATGGACGTPTGGNTTGITASTINIGLHAPLTGTGTPFPNTSFKNGAGTFWQQPGHTVCGRKVAVDFQDDTYTPSGAHQVCSAMAKRDFIVVGGGGTDQIQACATDPVVDGTGTPYLSAGVTTNGLTSLGNYFAVSLTYQQQGALVVQNAIKQGIAHPKKVNGAEWEIVTANTKNFDDATQGITSALDAAGITYHVDRVDQNGNYQAAATQFGQQLALAGYKTIYVDAAPGYFVFMTGGYYGADPSDASVNWVGPGVTYTEVTVAQYVCSSTKNQIDGHAWFLAPAPGIDRATDDFKQAYNGKYDDIEWSLWGLSQVLFDLLKNASSNLTRQNFIARTFQATVPGGVYPDVVYGGKTHFGGTGAWVQKISCGGTEPNQNQPGTWTTVGNDYLRLR